MAVLELYRDPLSVVLMTVPMGLLYGAHRVLRRQHRNVTFLHRSSRLLLSSEPLEVALTALLDQGREEFHATVAELTLFPVVHGEEPLRLRLAPGKIQAMTALGDLDDGDELARLLESGQVRADDDRRPREGRTGGQPADDFARYLRQRRLRDGMLAPLRGDRLLGALLLADRPGDSRTFSGDDVRLFEAFAHQLTAALMKERLERSFSRMAQLQEQLRQQALLDPLTGLGNRRRFAQQVEQALTRAFGAPRRVIVAFVDLDGFKEVNDTLGYATGDRLLSGVARRLQRLAGSCDKAARLDGDEFGLLVDTEPDSPQGSRGGATAALELAERVRDALAAPFWLSGRQVHVRVSIGVAVADRRAPRPSDLLRNAATALHCAKRSGNGSVALYRPEMRLHLLHSSQRRHELHRAVDDRQLEVHYQPIVNLLDERLIGTEALVRWRHPTQGLLAPDTFIPQAEEAGLVPAIGTLVLRRACQETADWQRRHDANLCVSVNLSASQLDSPDLTAVVAAALADADLDPGSLVLEVTESVLMRDPERSQAHLRHLKALGVGVALDDFGTGYSSLAYLQRLPIDTLKIAKEFIDGLGTSRDDGILLAAVLNLGATLGLRSLAEGIERPCQRDQLLAAGCSLGQGYLFSRPLTAADMETLLSDRRPVRAPPLAASR